MNIDVAGRVKNTSLAASRPLLPLYEAVVNSIHAIEEGHQSEGRVTISVERDDLHIYAETSPELGDIVGFSVTDNGVGFTERNFRAFNTADTTNKAHRGGKGNGRFLWLVAFEYVEVDSHFLDGEKLRRRHFVFSPHGEGIAEATLQPSDRGLSETTIKLVGYRDRYREQCPKKIETIATHLLEHCLEFFIRADCPAIVLRDTSSGESISLNELFETNIAPRSDIETVEVREERFNVLHVRVYTKPAPEPLIHYCANDRVVKSEKLLGALPNLARRLDDEDGEEFVYAAYVDSPALDLAVNADRTDFALPDDDSGLPTATLSWRAVQMGVLDRCDKYLAPYTAPIREKKRQRVQDFIASDGPMYRPILKHIQDKIDFIDPDSSDEALDLKLYQFMQEFQSGLRTEGQTLLRQSDNEEGREEFGARFQAYFDKVTDVNSAELARYVCHRRTVLDFLYKQLKSDMQGKYQWEDRVHQVIFPMGHSSDSVLTDDHNLWVLDETLVYHHYLASDRPLRAVEPLACESRKEPDIIVFDKACAFGDGTDPPFSAITIIEFKRPMRTEYTEKENPIQQVCGYITDIRSGKARTVDGRDIPVRPDTPFRCFIIADITPKLREFAAMAELYPTPDNDGYYGYKRPYQAYFEVMSYTRMVTNAKRRNAAFFEKLGISTRVT